MAASPSARVPAFSRLAALIAVALLSAQALLPAQQQPAPVVPTDAKGNPLPVVGATGKEYMSGDAVLAEQVSGATSYLWSISCWNSDDADRWVRLHNQTGAPGSGDGANVKYRMLIPAGSGFAESFPNGVTYATGLGIRITGGPANNNTTALEDDKTGCNVSYNN